MTKTPLENWIIERCSIEPNRDALDQYQIEAIKAVIAHGKKHSRYYNETFQQVEVDEIHEFSDLDKIPLTQAKDLRRSPYDFLCESQSNIERAVTLNTTGTTGDEKRIFFSKEDISATIDFFDYGMRCLTDESDRILVLLPGTASASIGDLLSKALARSHKFCIVHGIMKSVDDVEQIILSEGITCIVGIPLQILYLSRMKPGLFQRIPKVLLSTDYVPSVLVQELDELYQCKVYNHYGMTEMGYGGGVECEARHGYHLREADLYVEIIHPMTGLRVPEGTFGEVVITTLKRRTMPLIRYRTGDISAFEREQCQCGTFLRTLKKVEGRLVNQLPFHGQSITLQEIDEIVLKDRDIMDFTAILMKEDVLDIHLVSRHNYFYTRTSQIQHQLEAYFQQRLDQLLKIKVSVTEDDLSQKITHSMIKRKIIDARM